MVFVHAYLSLQIISIDWKISLALFGTNSVHITDKFTDIIICVNLHTQKLLFHIHQLLTLLHTLTIRPRPVIQEIQTSSQYNVTILR